MDERNNCQHTSIVIVTETNPRFIAKKVFVECEDCHHQLPIEHITLEERVITKDPDKGNGVTSFRPVTVSKDKIVTKEPKPIILEGWISVEDRLPDGNRGDVLCLDAKYDDVYIAGFTRVDENCHYFMDPHAEFMTPTHWLPFTVKMPEK